MTSDPHNDQPTGITVLLPGHGWDELASVRDAAAATDFLVSFITAWHPAILCSLGAKPTLQPVFDLHSALENQLIIVPQLVEAHLRPSLLGSDQANKIFRANGKDRSAFLQLLISELGISSSAESVGGEVVGDFWALAYTYLQTKLLTYRVHYSSGLDESLFAERVVQAADAAMARDEPARDTSLQAAFRQLEAERSSYYPADAYILQTAVLAESAPTWSEGSSLNTGVPLSLLATARALERLSVERPERHAELRTAIHEERLCLLGGELDEPPWFLMSAESVLRSLRFGRASLRHLIGAVPTVFARRRFGLSPLIAQALCQLGYVGIVQAVLDAGRHPVAEQPRLRLKLPDGRSLKALGKVPMAAHDAAAMLRLGTTMGASMELDYLATLSIVRWAHEPSPWLDDLFTGLARKSTVGLPASVADYFAADCHQISEERFPASELLSPYLKESIDAEDDAPVSQWASLTNAQSLFEQAESIASLCDAIAGHTDAEHGAPQREEIGRALVARKPNAVRLRDDAQQLLEDVARRFVQQVTGETRANHPNAASGVLLINPLGFSRQIHLRRPERLKRPADALAWCCDGAGTEALIGVGPFGYVYLPFDEDAGDPPAQRMIGDGLVLANEQLAVHLHEDSGTVRSVYDFRTRGNRLSQRLGLCEFGRPTPCTMVASSIGLVHNSCVSATIESRGHVQAAGEVIADYVQSITLVQGQCRFAADIELTPKRPPVGDAWKNYFCSTLALPHGQTDLHRALNWQRSPVAWHSNRHRLETCDYLEWSDHQRKTVLLPAGLPYHVQRERYVDTILQPPHEVATRFRIGVAIDPVDALRECLDFAADALVIPVCQPPPTPSAWLLHVDARHVTPTGMEVISEPDGSVCGLYLRLLESTGGSGPVTIRAFRPLTSARKCDFNGEPSRDCELIDGAAQLKINPHEWTQVELRW